jgi:2-methylcitrate dehydratase PrpD
MTTEVLSRTQAVAHHLRRPIGPDIRGRARLHLLDWLGCVAGALRTPVADAARRAGPDVLERVGYLGNVLEMDDVHRAALLHPGPVVWPAALSAAREVGADMAAMLDGAVQGYEAMIAVGATFDAYHYAHWHPTGTAGGFGGVAAAAAIFGLSPEQMIWALGHAGSTACGLWHMRHADVMTKQLHVVHAALEGLWCARAARAGFTGPTAILEGPQGLYEAMTREPKPLALGEGWRMAEVSFKPWAACRHAHPAIDAALSLKAEGALAGEVLVETYADALTFCDRPKPRTPVEAKFSLQHAVAVVAERGTPTPADFEPDAIAALSTARARVRVAEAAEFTARYPGHFGAKVTAGGRTSELVDTLGDPERPLSRDGVIAKTRALMAWGGLPDATAKRGVTLALEGDDPAALVAWLEEVV